MAEKRSTVDQLDDMMRLVGEELATFANSDAIVGSPIEFSTATVVPISSVSIGIAGGGAGGEGEGKVSSSSKQTSHGQGAGGASTGAAKVRPIAVIVFTANAVQVLPVPEKSTRRDKVIEMVPDLVQRLTKALNRRSAEQS